MTVLEELHRSMRDPVYSDCWSNDTCRIYFGAAAWHGLEVVPVNVPDIYSYAIEAAEALEP
jgi:hypothetical protein